MFKFLKLLDIYIIILYKYYLFVFRTNKFINNEYLKRKEIDFDIN